MSSAAPYCFQSIVLNLMSTLIPFTDVSRHTARKRRLKRANKDFLLLAVWRFGQDSRKHFALSAGRLRVAPDNFISDVRPVR
jgi:hypothetical protein